MRSDVESENLLPTHHAEDRPTDEREGARDGTQTSATPRSSSQLQPDTLAEGSSLQYDVESQYDLENQSPSSHLTPTQRVRLVFNRLFPIRQTYERINNGLTTGRMQTNAPGRFIGQGTDGVFRNLMAKPDTESHRLEQEAHPPTYEEAAADATPEYWDLTVILPIFEDEVFVEGLPVGNLANYVWNILVTVAFQYVGFILCLLLHTSHAASYGCKTGLGITIIIQGWSLVPSNFGNANLVPERYEPLDPNAFDITKSDPIDNGSVDDYALGLTKVPAEDLSAPSAPYVAYGLIALGVFIIVSSICNFYRVKQMERAILAPSTPTVAVAPEPATTEPATPSPVLTPAPEPRVITTNERNASGGN